MFRAARADDPVSPVPFCVLDVEPIPASLTGDDYRLALRVALVIAGHVHGAGHQSPRLYVITEHTTASAIALQTFHQVALYKGFVGIN